MNDVAWEITHSIDACVTPTFAWTYMTNVANWDDPPASFELDGPFAAGSRGTTHIPGQDARHWQLREVHPIASYIFEMPLDRATISFEWQFEARADGNARLTQHIVLSGENAAAYVDQVRPAFSSTQVAGRIEDYFDADEDDIANRLDLDIVLITRHSAGQNTAPPFYSFESAIDMI